MNLGQSKKHSIFEAIANIFLGYWIGVLTQIIVFPFFNINISFKENMIITIIFSIVSLVRSYVLRRIFNWFHVIYLCKKIKELKRSKSNE